MTEEQKALLQIQLDNIVALLDGELKHFTCVDYTGRHWNKIEISYETESV